MNDAAIPETVHRASDDSTPRLSKAPATHPPFRLEPPDIPDHDLVHVIGCGAYGDVWLARNRKLGRLRAIKVVYREAFDHDGPFLREFKGVEKFESISRSHEGLVDILAVGGTDDTFYYVMELADNAARDLCSPEWDGRAVPPNGTPTLYSPRTLTSELRSRGSLPLAECVDIGLRLTRALGQLHREGLVHRDIKPSNVIFVGGLPKLADVGLVTSVNEARSFVGTEGYIPPEGPGTPQGDLYSLGRVLYELVTGKDRRDFPDPPTRLGDLPDRKDRLEFDAVLLKAGSEAPPRRYQRASEMESELSALKSGLSVIRIRKRKRNVQVCLALLAIAAVAAIHRFTATHDPVAAASGAPPGRLSETRDRAPHPEAVQAYKTGMESATQWTTDGLSRSIQNLRDAIRIDPNYADPYTLLSTVYRNFADWHLPPRQALAEAKQASVHAVRVAPSLPKAHVALGFDTMLYDYDWDQAERHFRRAVELGPSEVWPHSAYAVFLMAMGRYDEAETRLNLALTVDPDAAGDLNVARKFTAHLALHRGDFRQAIGISRKLIDDGIDGFANRIVLADALIYDGAYPEAVRELNQLRVEDDAPDLLATLAYVHARTGDRETALEYLAKLDQLAAFTHVSPYFKAYIAVGLDHPQRALDLLWDAYREGSISLVGGTGGRHGIQSHPFWIPLHAHARFHALLDALDLKLSPTYTTTVAQTRP